MLGLVRGDRLPDYQRPDPQGKMQMLHDLHSGLPVIVIACRDPRSSALHRVLNTLKDTSGYWSHFTRIAIVQAPPQQCATLLPSDMTTITVMADDNAVLQHLIGPPTRTTSPVAVFALDSNLSIIDRFEQHDDQRVDELLDAVQNVYDNIPSSEASVIREQAPVLLIPRVLDKDFCDGLIAFFEETGGQPSGVAHIDGDKANWRPDPSVKMRRDVYLSEGIWLERVRQMLIRRVLPEIERCFSFRVTQHEIFKLIRYDEGAGYFRPHRDNESRDTQHRRFAMTLNLNTGDYDGGQLHFPEFGPQLYEAERGGAAIFSCSLLHEAMPVTRGKRYALLGFFFGDEGQMAEMQYQSGGQTS